MATAPSLTQTYDHGLYDAAALVRGGPGRVPVTGSFHQPEHGCIYVRMEVERNNVMQFGGELWNIGQLERLELMIIQPVGAP